MLNNCLIIKLLKYRRAFKYINKQWKKMVWR